MLSVGAWWANRGLLKFERALLQLVRLWARSSQYIGGTLLVGIEEVVERSNERTIAQLLHPPDELHLDLFELHHEPAFVLSHSAQVEVAVAQISQPLLAGSRDLEFDDVLLDQSVEVLDTVEDVAADILVRRVLCADVSLDPVQLVEDALPLQG